MNFQPPDPICKFCGTDCHGACEEARAQVRGPSLIDCITWMAASWQTEGRPMSKSASQFTMQELSRATLANLRAHLDCKYSSDERLRAMLHDLIVAALEGRETTESEPVPKTISVSKWQRALKRLIKK